MGKARNRRKKEQKKKKKQQKVKLQAQNNSMNPPKVSVHEVGFSFIAAQIRERDPGHGFVLQIEDPSFIINDEELYLEVGDVHSSLNCATDTNGVLLEVTGSKLTLGSAFKSSLQHLIRTEKPDSTSLFNSDTEYFKLVGKAGGLFFGDQMIVAHKDLMKVFSAASRQFTHDYSG